MRLSSIRLLAALPLVAALVLAGCGRAPLASGSLRAALQAQASQAQALEAMRPAVDALMTRCFEIMTTGYSNKSTIDANDLHEYLGVGTDHCGALIQAIDTDGDHKASKFELGDWGCAAGGLLTMRDAVISPAFAHADTDGNQQLGFIEAHAASIALGDQPAWPLTLTRADFEHADRDHNGTLAINEFDALASGKLAEGVKTAPAKQLPVQLAKVFFKFKTIPWSH